MFTTQRSLRSTWVCTAAIACVGAVALLAGCSSSSSTTASTTSAATSPTSASTAAPLSVSWMPGFAAPGTPAKYNQVGIIKVGPSNAKNVLVLEPGTSAGATYFVPLAKWVTEKTSDWQVWSVERRENLLEDQSELNLYKQHKATSAQLFDYYLGYLKNKTITHHFQPVADSTVEFAKQWGMNVAVQDLHVVIDAAKKLGGKVVLGGHSLGGSVVTAYATWDFGGHAGANDLAGLVYIDGGSSATPESAQAATQSLQALNAPSASPWLNFGGIPAPYAGVFVATGASAALFDPDSPSLGQTSGLLPASIVPPVRATNEGQYGYALNPATSPENLAAAQAHLGKGLDPTGPVHGWDGTGALTPIDRFATMFSGAGIQSADGSEWYFPQRLTNDTRVVNNGNANPGQAVLGVDATMAMSSRRLCSSWPSVRSSAAPACPRTRRSSRSNRASPRPTSRWRTTRAPTRTTIRTARIPTTPSSIGSSRSSARSPEPELDAVMSRPCLVLATDGTARA
jgi:pimeloyl-ACP methyl ester carboxylesterase